MPIGIIINALSIVIGGILGAFVGHKLSPKFKEDITLVFGVCSMGMGISTIGLMENMPAVIFSVVIGTGIGLAIHLGERINAGAGVMQRVIGKFIKNSNSELSEDEFMNTLVTIIVLFCASGTGIYGSIVSGMSGDHSVLISKSILDLFTAAIFACSDKPFKTKDLSAQIHSARLSFAKPEYMEKYLDITPGSVSVLGLMNDSEKKVQLLIDEDVMKEPYFGCHPCINTSSLKFTTEDLMQKIIPALEHEPVTVTLPVPE